MAWKVLFGIVAALTLVAIGIGLLARAREANTRETWPAVGQFVDVEGTRIHALVMGQGPDLVLLHGAGGNLREFTFGLAQSLQDRYRVILLDRPGLGYSDRAVDHGILSTRAATPKEQAHLLSQAAAQLGAERPIVMGHSFGGAVALAWGLEHDPAALVLMSAASMPWPGPLSPTYKMLGSSVGGALVPGPITAFVSDAAIGETLKGIFAPQPVPQGYASHIGARLSVQRNVLRTNARQVLGLRPQIVEMSKRYSDLSLPVELLHGDADTIVPLDVHSHPLSEVLPNANLTVLPGVGHMPHHVAADTLVSIIDTAAARAGLR